MRLRIDIRRKDGLSDPEGLATRRALLDLGYEGVDEVHFGRTIFIDVDGDDPVVVTSDAEQMCRQLLANPVIEDYEIAIVDGVGA